MSCVADALSREYETYENHKEQLVASSLGKYVLISGDKILGEWDTYEDALKSGYETCGIDKPFMVQRVNIAERVHVFYRGTVA